MSCKFQKLQQGLVVAEGLEVLARVFQLKHDGSCVPSQKPACQFSFHVHGMDNMKGPCQIKVASGLPQIEIPGIVPFCSLHLSHNTVSVEAVLSTSRTRKVEITLGLGQASVAVLSGLQSFSFISEVRSETTRSTNRLTVTKNSPNWIIFH